MIPTYPTTLVAKAEVADNTWQFVLQTPNNFTFHAGQYVFLDFAEPIHRDNRPSMRAMSIASAPEEEHLLFLMRLSDSAFKKNMAQLQPGDALLVNGPLGHVALPSQPLQPAVFVVAGVGITAARAMMMHEIYSGGTRPMTLFYSNKYRTDIAWHDALATMTAPSYRYVPTLTREEGVWDGERGRIDAAMIARYVDEPSRAVYYIVGAKEFIATMRDVLTQMHIPQTQMICDNFG